MPCPVLDAVNIAVNKTYTKKNPALSSLYFRSERQKEGGKNGKQRIYQIVIRTMRKIKLSSRIQGKGVPSYTG